MATTWNGIKVKSIRVFSRGEGGDLVPVAKFEATKKKKKISRWARPANKNLKRVLDAQKVWAETMEDRRDRSNRKKKDGFLREWNYNKTRANRKAWKILRKIRPF